jgi:cation transport regulator ChaB
MPVREDLPGTLKRSPKHAQEIYSEAHDNAVRSYGEGERAHRTALAALKHSYEKVGDRWAPKKRRGPSDPRAAEGGSAARRGRGESFGGVDYFGHTKDELYDRARKLGIKGRSRMNKRDLARAIDRKQD